MTKCDFCNRSYEGKCLWTSYSKREFDCDKAIALMIRTLTNINKTSIIFDSSYSKEGA